MKHGEILIGGIRRISAVCTVWSAYVFLTDSKLAPHAPRD
jgi:hypothetical protein